MSAAAARKLAQLVHALSTRKGKGSPMQAAARHLEEAVERIKTR